MTRKYILLFILSSFLFLEGKSQDKEFKPEWNIGIGGGPTFSSVSFEPFFRTKSKQQYHGGVAIRYISEKNLGLIAELNYSQQGWEQDFSRDNNTKNLGLQHSHQLNYLELPVLTHIYFGRKVRFFVNMGPKLSFLLSESETMNKELEDFLASGNAPADLKSYQYYRNANKKIDYGLMGGVGLEFRTGIGYFTLEGRYTFGLGDIYNNSKADYFTRSANRNMSAKLTYYVKLF